MTRIFKVAFLTVGLAAGLTACPGPVVKKPPVQADKPDGTTEAQPPDKGDKPAAPPKGW